MENIFETNKKYQVIYADPPWSYNTWKDKGNGVARKHYSCMTTKEIQALPVKEISDTDSLLFLWTTFPCLEEGLELVKAWGFKYKTIGFNWVKKNKKSDSYFFGTGHYTRANSEICIIGVKGKGHKHIKNRSVSQVICTKVEGHSKKPDDARNRIDTLVGDVNKIELFARQEVTGWDCWGNEV